MENISVKLIKIEIWFIPFDIIMIISTILVILLSICFLLIIIFDKTCHKISMIFIINSCICSFIVGCSMFSLCIFTLNNDLQQIIYEDSFCRFRAYLTYVSPGLIKYSFLLQALHRYLTIFYPNISLWKSIKFYILTILFTWLFSLIYPFIYIFSNEIIYNIDNQICQLQLRFSFPLIYTAFCIYIIPMSMIMIIYSRLIRYVHQINQHLTHIRTIKRAKKQLKMIQRIVILNLILLILGFPYILFVFISFFISPPKYHFRIAFLFIDISFLFMMIILFQFTDPLKESLIKKFKRRSNLVGFTIT